MALIPFLLLSLPLANAAFTWTFQAAPQQCANLSIQTSESGTPPYRALIIPFGPSPLANNTEVRRIVDQPFRVSDATGFGTGGTSVATQVTPSNDSSCLGQSTVQPDFVFSIEPPNQIVQCQPTRIWWDPSVNTIQGLTSPHTAAPEHPTSLELFLVANPSPFPNCYHQCDRPGNWVLVDTTLRSGTTFLLVGGDKGVAGMGKRMFIVSSGTTVNKDA
ncbi:hypothetical protein BD779DRAFT_1466997 [Infundibulicybe gibba]|nr:hypothetical protein BD779DRAFT_1466997 [Infundibulicybe gibba]